MDRDLRQQQRENLKLREEVENAKEEVENAKDEVAKLQKEVAKLKKKVHEMEMKSKLDRSIIADQTETIGGLEEHVQLQGKIIDAVKETDKLDHQNPSLGKKRKIITL